MNKNACWTSCSSHSPSALYRSSVDVFPVLLPSSSFTTFTYVYYPHLFFPRPWGPKDRFAGALGHLIFGQMCGFFGKTSGSNQLCLASTSQQRFAFELLERQNGCVPARCCNRRARVSPIQSHCRHSLLLSCLEKTLPEWLPIST